MVQISDPTMFRPDPSSKPSPPPLAVKLEIDDSVEDQFGPLQKRSRPSVPFQQEWRSEAASTLGGSGSQQVSTYNPLNEPSPLGLRLRKSPSLLELIQMKLTNASATTPCVSESEHSGPGKRKDVKLTAVSGSADKLKASNFPASLLRIGTWECVSRYEGDLVAKCYFAKHKLVWEVLDGGLKSKIEIQWSDITALRASCPENKPGTLDIVLARQPLFFKETNPQPRKHTLWQATSDFTGGQASIHRKHFLQCPPGLLSKHFEKLIQCDPRLFSLSLQPDVILDSPYFEPRCSAYEEQEETKCSVFNPIGDYGPSFSGLHDLGSTCSASPATSRNDVRDLSGSGRIQDFTSPETPSPSSVMVTKSVEEVAKSEAEDLKNSNWDQFKVPGLHPSMSMSDLMNHIGNCISGQRASASSLMPGADKESQDMLDEITRHLLSDSQFSMASDENSLMTRVNSLCCLLQKDSTAAQGLPLNGGAFHNDSDDKLEETFEKKFEPDSAAAEGVGDDDSPRKQPSTISRKESMGDLLLNLPRIASMPQFLFNISEDGQNKAR